MVRCLVPLVVAALVVAEADAQPTTKVTFERVLGLAGELPELVVMQQVAREERTIALPLAWNPLQVLLSAQRRLAPSASRGFEGGISLQQQVPLADINGARRSVLERQGDARAARAAAVTLDNRLVVAAAWISAWRARERRVVAEREYELAKAIVTVTERGLTLGVFTTLEVADAKAFLAETDVRRVDAEGDVMHEGFALARATATTGALLADGALPDVPLPPSGVAEQLLVKAKQMPAVTAKLLAARVSRARAAEERATRRAQLIVGGEVFRDEPGALVGGVTLGFTLSHDRGEREAREAELEARTAEAEAATLVQRSVTDLASALHEVEHTREALVKLRVLVPAAEDAAARRQRAVEIGESTVVELLAARRTALLARARLTDAEAAHAWARLEAWLLLEAAGGDS